MDWVKLAVRYYADPRVEQLDDAAELMFVRGLARAGEVGQEGFIPEASLPQLARRRRYETSVNALLSNGLWTRAPGGFRVSAWSDWQDGMDELTRRRTADRERKRRKRAQAKLSADSPRTVRPLEGEKDTGVQVGDQGHRPRAREAPPPKCVKHLNDPKPPACGACADARRSSERWHSQRAARLAAAPKCRKHRGQLAANCALCRAEQLAAS